MTESTPPRPSLAAFLRGAPAEAAAPAGPEAPVAAASTPQAGEAAAEIATPEIAPAPPPKPAPAFLHRAAPVARTPRWQWALIPALLVLLALQIVVADRARLAADARWRPLVSGVCAALRCSVPPWHEPQAFNMLGREVRPVPGAAGVLQVRASFRNDARWAQAWPQLQLSLTDADGRVIGSQVFAPAQYLGAAPAADALLAPGQSAQVAFRVREPSAGTEAFAFAFR